MIHRRDLLKFAAGGLAGGAAFAPAFGQTAAPRPDPTPFSSALPTAAARELAKAPFRAPATTLPEPFANLNYDQYVGIAPRAGAAIWGGENLPFAVEPLHRGFIFSTPMQILLVENETARPLAYDAGLFDFGKLAPPAGAGDIGYSGFRLLRARPGAGLAEIAIFQGASFFRSRAIGQNLGIVARSLAIRTADPKGEEFPILRTVWIEKPTPAATAIVVHAVLDSPSLTGAYRFTLRPGEATIVDIEATLFTRAAVEHLGFAAMQATSLFGPTDRRRSDDARPGVYEVTGLQMANGAGEWLYRPVANREMLQLSSFVDENPKGFGLVMRERNFGQFQDDDQHWEQRPSLWIEPIGDWGPGLVQLVEIPAENESNDNIVAYWRPRQAYAAGAEIAFAYRQFWCWDPPERPPLALATLTRQGRAPGGRRRRFIVEFSGDVLADPVRAADVRARLTASPGTVSGLRTILSREGKSCRALFDVDPGSDGAIEMRLDLVSGGKPISEAWLYRWTA